MQLVIMLLGVFLLYTLQRYLYHHFWDKDLSVDVQFSKDRAIEGETLSLTETISNMKFLPLPILHVKFHLNRSLIFSDSNNNSITDQFYRDDLISVLMYQRSVYKLDFTCSRRGYYTLSEVDIIGCDLFMSSMLAKHMKVFQEFYVYPKLLNYERIQIPFQSMLGSLITKRYYNDDPLEFAGIREYQTYDSMKYINWSASAKTGALKVNTHEYTSSQSVVIYLNLEKPTLLDHPELMEESIRLAATYSDAFIHAGIPVSLYTNSREISTEELVHVRTGSNLTHLEAIYEALARIDLNKEISTFLPLAHEWTKTIGTNDYILLISTYQKQDLQDYLSELIHTKHNLYWIVPMDSAIRNDIHGDLLHYVYPYQMDEVMHP